MTSAAGWFAYVAAFLAAVAAVTAEANSGSTNPLFRQNDFDYNARVPLTHCARLGPHSDLMFEWQLSFAPKWTLELRFTADVQRGFTAIGFSKDAKREIITGYPDENIHCARQLFDTYSNYDVFGNVYPNFPEVPGKVTYSNASHVVLYLMRNLSLSSRQFLESDPNGAELTVTLMWSFMQQSLFNAACYMSDVDQLTEYANFKIILGDTQYLQAATGCANYEGTVTAGGPTGRILDDSGELLASEYFQNNRVAALFLAGDLMVTAGNSGPLFNGWVRGGDNANGVCSSSTTEVFARWTGFSQPIGGITKYEATIGTQSLPSLFASRYDAGTNLNLQIPVDGMGKNFTYIVRLTAFDFAGLTRTVVSKPLTVLNNGLPVWGTIFVASSISANIPVSYQASAHQIVVKMPGWVREDHSAKDYNTLAFTDNGFDYAAGDATGVDTIKAWTHVAAFVHEFTVSGLVLVNNVPYTVSIRSTNCAGTTTQLTTDPVTVDLLPPSGGIIRVGNSSRIHLKYTTTHTPLAASWWGFTDYISGIGGYEWAVSTHLTPPSLSGGSGMVKPWVSAGHATHAIGASLEQLGTSGLVGTNIYVHIKVIDNVGNFFVKTSNATMVVGF